MARGGVSAGEVTSKTFFLPPGRKPSGSKDVYVTETGGRSGSPTPPRQGGKRVVDLIEAMDKEEADADIAEIRRQHQHRGGETAGAAAAAAAAMYTLTSRGQAAEATPVQLGHYMSTVLLNKSAFCANKSTCWRLGEGSRGHTQMHVGPV